jgi:hypothetical protein
MVRIFRLMLVLFYIYINSTIIPPIMIYENQNLLYIVPLMRHTAVVCITNISPMVIGCFVQ